MNKIFVLIGFVFLVFVVIVVFQISTRPISNILKNSSASKATINSATFQVELARTPKEKVEGLSGRENLSQDAGMLFLFDKPSYYTFWMRGMKFPLDMIFILDDKVVAVFENLPPATEENPPQYGSDILADKVLEINAGEARKNNIKVGDSVVIEIK